MWRAVEDELKSIKVENLGYDHPLCSGILDDCSTPITEIPERSREAFKASSKKYHIRHCKILKNICEDYVLKENKKISTKMFEDFGDASFGEFLDRPERLKELTNQMLEVLYVSYSSLVDLYKLTLTLSKLYYFRGQAWKSPKWRSFMETKNPSINEGSYVCEILSCKR